MKKIETKELNALQKLKELHKKQMLEMRKLSQKHQKALVELSQKLGINFNKSLKKEIYRKLIHLSSLWIPALIYFTNTKIAITIFSTIFRSE